MVYTDSIGNAYLGDCSWANHSVGFPTIKFLQGLPLGSNFSSELTALCDTAGLLYRNVVPQIDIDNYLSSASPSLQKSLLHFGSAGDIDDRYGLYVAFSGNNTGSGGPSTLFNNNGSTNETNLLNEDLNLLSRTSNAEGTYGLSGGFIRINFNRLNLTDYSPIQVCGVADAYSISLFFTQKRLISGTGLGILSLFVHAGLLADVNTNFNYYSATKFNSSFIMAGGINSLSTSVTESNLLNSAFTVNARHYISATSKYPLVTGDASYAIVCSDGQNPTSQWATDMYVFDNNSDLGNPAIGRVRNLLLATGSYTIGKPVKIEGTAMPDAGFNRWLPVGNYAGKVLLMRCYSTVDI